MPNDTNKAANNVTPISHSKNTTSNTEILEKVIDVYENLGKNSLDGLTTLYTKDVYFEDPAHAIQGISALTDYFEKLFDNVENCQFRFHNSLCQGDKLFLCWTMTLQHKSLKGGQKIFVEGASLLKVRHHQVYYHRDYFDLGSMLYENLPILGSLIRRIKKGLSS